MKVLMITNRLYPFGGAETYAYSVGESLKNEGHIVEYFGIDYKYDSFRNNYGIYAKKSHTPFSIVRSKGNCSRLSKLLDLFKPDIVHLHLIYFTLTPAIIYTIKQHNIPIIQTIHDSKWICPNYQLFIPNKKKACHECIDGHFFRCVKNRCFKNSYILSALAYIESRYYQDKKVMSLIDRFIFPSTFMRDLHQKYGLETEKCITLCNFSRISLEDERKNNQSEFGKYVLYFGRLSKEKGMDNLLRICDILKNIKFVIAGEGDYSSLFKKKQNCVVVGFKNGRDLLDLITQSICTVYPSIWYENCPLSVIESLTLGVPVVASNIGGIPDLISDGQDGFLIDCDNVELFAKKIENIYYDVNMRENMSDSAIKLSTVFSKKTHVLKLIDIYSEVINENDNIE